MAARNEQENIIFGYSGADTFFRVQLITGLQ
jgi:hypothetical protein